MVAKMVGALDAGSTGCSLTVFAVAEQISRVQLSGCNLSVQKMVTLLFEEGFNH
jgi:hypothetical protein